MAGPVRDRKPFDRGCEVIWYLDAIADEQAIVVEVTVNDLKSKFFREHFQLIRRLRDRVLAV